MPKRPTTELSIVIPVYNEAANIRALFKELNSLQKKLPKQTEVILVDDGSKDDTVQKIRQTQLKYRKHVIQLSRNFGHQSALFAGLQEATGKYVVTMDGDLQHPPKLIPKMLQQHKHGVNIVLTQRLDTQATSHFKKRTASF